MGRRSTTRVRVYYPSGRNLQAWQDRHSRGDAPDRWPYGLNRLEDHFDHVEARNFVADSLIRRGMRRIFRSAAAPSRSKGGPAGIIWDETTVDRLAFSRGLGGRYSGVVWLTDGISRKGGEAYEGMRHSLRKMDALWVLSGAQVAPLTQFVGVHGPAVHHVLFGVDTDFFEVKPIPSSPLIVSVGGDRDRDPETLFAALNEVRASRPDIEIIVQSKSGISPPPGVVVIPYLTHAELRDLYARASLVLVATRPNGHVSGMTVGLEAMATGRPVVITESPGMSDYFGHTDGARMVETGAPRALAEAALHLLGDPIRLAAAGSAARRHVEERFTTTHLTRRLAVLVASSSSPSQSQ